MVYEAECEMKWAWLWLMAGLSSMDGSLKKEPGNDLKLPNPVFRDS